MVARTNTVQKGRKSEMFCAKYLKTLGYSVIKQNWYCRWGEIDIIAKMGSELIFVEVKSVSSRNYCNAIDLFSSAKRHKLIKSINYFIFKYKICYWRLDLVCLTREYDRVWIEHYKNVLAL